MLCIFLRRHSFPEATEANGVLLCSPFAGSWKLVRVTVFMLNFLTSPSKPITSFPSVSVSRRGPMSCSVDFFHFSVVDTLCCLPFYWCSEKGYCHGSSSRSLSLPLTLVQVGKCYPCCQGNDIIGGFHWSVFELKRSRVSQERSRCGIWPHTKKKHWMMSKVWITNNRGHSRLALTGCIQTNPTKATMEYGFLRPGQETGMPGPDGRTENHDWLGQIWTFRA